MELGMYGKALTLVPAASMNFWKQLPINYTQNLANQDNEQSTIDLDAVDYYLQQCVFYHAMSERCTDLIPDYDSSTNNTDPISEPQS
jgi:hypothetical protein